MITHHPPMLALNDEAPENAYSKVVTPDTSLEGEGGRGVRAVRPTTTSRSVRWGGGVRTCDAQGLGVDVGGRRNVASRMVTPDTSMEGEGGRAVRYVSPNTALRSVRWGGGVIVTPPSGMTLTDRDRALQY